MKRYHKTIFLTTLLAILPGHIALSNDCQQKEEIAIVKTPDIILSPSRLTLCKKGYTDKKSKELDEAPAIKALYMRYRLSMNEGLARSKKITSSSNARKYNRTLETIPLLLGEKKNIQACFYHDMSEQNKSAFFPLGNPSGNKNQLHRKEPFYGLIWQRGWRLSDKTFVTSGLGWQKEEYYPSIENYQKLSFKSRQTWSFFSQLEHAPDAQSTASFSLRHTFSKSDDKNYSNLSLAGSIVRKMSAADTLYFSTRQSFDLPTFSQLYGAQFIALANSNLKPQTGISYELGWKKNHDKHKWQTAIFRTAIKNSIAGTRERRLANYRYENEDFHNSGLVILSQY